MAKVSRKKQGNVVDGAGMSSANIIRDPQHLGRGIGSAYAVAVENIKDQADEMQGSKAAFLGVEKKVVNHLENLHCSLLPKGFNPKEQL